MESILESIKKLLGIAAEYDQFDTDIIIHINTAFSKLNQLGVGPEEGFSIRDKTSTWEDFLSDNKNLEAVKTYVYLIVRLVFDPPLNSAVLTAMDNTINQLEWRLNVAAEQSSKE